MDQDDPEEHIADLERQLVSSGALSTCRRRSHR
jgi:hypothetical protein